MCDYSLEHYKSRDARKGDRLTTQRFTSGSQGFIEDGGDKDCAVCLQPGTRLSLTMPDGTATTAIFVQPDKQPMGHRDSLLMAGKDEPTSLQKIVAGTKAVVMALPRETMSTETEAEGEVAPPVAAAVTTAIAAALVS